MTPVSATDSALGIKYPNAAAKDARLACMVADEPVYRRAYYTPNMDEQDVMVAHDNNADIKAFMEEQRIAAAKPQSAGIKGAAAKNLNKVK